MLIQTSELDHNQLAAIDALSAECKHTDGNMIAIYRHLLVKDRGRPSNILYYHKQRLTGFLGAFFFHEKICEIAVMVAPTSRRHRVASRMLNAVLALLYAEGIERVVFSSPHGLNDHWFPALNLSFQGSEFQMQRHARDPLPIQTSSTHIRIANDDDIPALCAIDKACFSSQKTDMPARFHSLLHDPEMCLFIINQDDVTLGKAHLTWQPTGARLSDVGITPSAQGRGLGTALLTHCINHALAANKSTIVLDVEPTNTQALGLYTRLGFTMTNAHDYWNIDRLGLTAFLRRP